MRVFIAVIILIFSLQSWTKADDIRDFEIEGISLYDSALLHFTESELKEGVSDNYTSDKFSTSAIFKTFEEYDYLQLSFKKNDSKYIIQDISATKEINYSKCLKDIEDIKNQIFALYENSSEIRDDGKKTYEHPADKSGETKVTDIAWYFNNGDVILVQCYNWKSKFGKKNNSVDELKIVISNKEFDKWIQDEAWK